MAQISTIKNFYLENYDFQMFVNKNCQTYGKSLDYMLSTPTTIAYYKYMNEGRKYGKGQNQCQGGDVPTDNKG